MKAIRNKILWLIIGAVISLLVTKFGSYLFKLDSVEIKNSTPVPVEVINDTIIHILPQKKDSTLSANKLVSYNTKVVSSRTFESKKQILKSDLFGSWKDTTQIFNLDINADKTFKSLKSIIGFKPIPIVGEWQLDNDRLTLFVDYKNQNNEKKERGYLYYKIIKVSMEKLIIEEISSEKRYELLRHRRIKEFNEQKTYMKFE